MAEEEGRDSVTEVTSTSWLRRLGQSFGGVILGFALIIGSGILLFWNEGRAVTTANSLKEGAAAVVNVAADKIDPANDKKLVHMTGDAKAAGPVVDPDFGISAPALPRRMEFLWACRWCTSPR